MLKHWSSLTYMAEIARTVKTPLAHRADIVSFEMILVDISRWVEDSPKPISAAPTYVHVSGFAMVHHQFIPRFTVKVTSQTQAVTCRVNAVLLPCCGTAKISVAPIARHAVD